jgi:hypothetical protein
MAVRSSTQPSSGELSRFVPANQKPDEVNRGRGRDAVTACPAIASRRFARDPSPSHAARQCRRGRAARLSRNRLPNHPNDCTSISLISALP